MDRTDISRRVMHRVALINTLAALLGFLVTLAFFLYHIITNAIRRRDAPAEDDCDGCTYDNGDFKRDMIHDWILYPLLMSLFLLLLITNRALHSALRHDEIKVHRVGTYSAFLGFLRGKYTKRFLFGHHHPGDAKLEASAAVAGSGAPVEVVSATGAPVEVVSTTGVPARGVPTTVTGTTGAPTTVVETSGAPTTVVETPASPAPVVQHV